ncbi:hypothetical protein Ddye_025122 [Dipteronia dyeriana]|uniref:Uncharacterized protein n=1 Tax=Dipteronia dyeriana TaxID=168575 RepID=A0AAD9TW51_9ROSI|nr:hypothetical protein Ddye_025122 [Dipteronia dyeriana]
MCLFEKHFRELLCMALSNALVESYFAASKFCQSIPKHDHMTILHLGSVDITLVLDCCLTCAAFLFDLGHFLISSTFSVYRFADIQIKLHGDECLVCSSKNAVYQAILFVQLANCV